MTTRNPSIIPMLCTPLQLNSNVRVLGFENSVEHHSGNGNGKPLHITVETSTAGVGGTPKFCYYLRVEFSEDENPNNLKES